jgi:hypothetical protein
MANKAIVKHAGNAFPDPHDPADTVSVDIPRDLIPLLAGLIATWEQRRIWQTYDDWEKGYQASLLLQESLITP